MSPVAGSQAIEYAAVYYCRPSVEAKMDEGMDPDCFGSELTKSEVSEELYANVAGS